MTIHLGILVLMIAITAAATLRMRRRREASDLLLVLLAVTAAGIEGTMAAREARFDAAWDELSRQELELRSDRIVDFLREKGTDALAQIRAVGDDPDTRSLLQLSRPARRPVFLDLKARFPQNDTRGVTIYDAGGTPRAWSGWSPTATTSLAREPSHELESVTIRDGNIYTLLEVIHPVRDERGGPLGYVVYQEPLRVQFPLENPLLRVKDVLERLEGGGGVRADVALEMHVDAGTDPGSITRGALKWNVDVDVASSTAAILSASGEPSGRVSLSGLTRRGMFLDRLATLADVRAGLLLAIFGIVLARLWFLASALPAALIPLARLSLIVAGRRLLAGAAPREAMDVLGVFDPSVFASIRYAGLLQSPGDLVLTGAALLLAVREMRRLGLAQESRLVAFARRYPWAATPVGLISSVLIGSVVALHWHQVLDIARNANVALYGGLDPFTSAPVAALEVALLFAGMVLLLAADTLGSVALALLSRWKWPIASTVVLALALFASSTKMGTPSEFTAGDFLRPLPATLVLAVFHFVSRRWGRPGGAAILVTALLAAFANVTPVFEGVEARRRELVELLALEHTESPSNTRQFILESTLDYLATSEELLEVLEDGPGPEVSNLAFILWARSPLATTPAGSNLRIRDAQGRAFSRFSLGFPAELRAGPDADATGLPTRGETSFRREEVGSARMDVYSGRVPVGRGGRALGVLEIAMAFPDELARRDSRSPDVGHVFTNFATTEEFLRFTRDVPERIDRYRGETLVASTDQEGGLGTHVPPLIVHALEGSDTDGEWVSRRIRDKLWNLYCIRERDGDVTVGYLTFGIEQSRPLQIAEFVARGALTTLVIGAGLLLLLILSAWLLPRGTFPHRVDVPRPGFRERVIGGFLLVSLVPTVLLGLAGRGLFVQEKRQQFEERLEEDLRVSRELLGRRLSDAARNAAGADEVVGLLGEHVPYRTLSTPASVDGIVVMSAAGQLLGASRSADLDMAILPTVLGSLEAPLEFFRRRGNRIYACALVPVPPRPGREDSGGAVLAFKEINEVLAAELERRVGSSVSFFAGGQLAATSKPELYQSEILSDLVDSNAYQRIELESVRQLLQEHRVGQTSFLSSYAPLLGARDEPVGILSTIAPFHGAGLDPGASQVVSRIYFLCLLVLTVAVAAAFVLAGRLTRPISELTRGAERIRGGSLGVRIHTRATGEIGRLVRSFNQMSEQLAESEARDRERREYIEAIIRHVGSGVVSVDAAGRVATVNEAAARILHVDPAALLGHAVGDVRGDAALKAVLSSVVPLLSGGSAEIVTELEVETPGTGDGDELRSFRLVATPLVDSQGRSQGAVAVFEDLTDLIKSKKIKAWAEMARQVAHEIKNPLTPMKLSAQHLRQAWRDRHPKFDRILEESTETIVDRCEALRRIAVEFSDYARMPGRRIRREELGGLLREARRLYGEAEERTVEFRLDLPEEELFTRVDRDEVMRLFINLIENSMQAMPTGGSLAVRALRDNGAACVTIHDTGVGISSENLRRIFEPSFSTKTGGAGLGLPICRAIMEDYGGSIEIDSACGRGTTVTLSFPVDEREATA